MKIYWGLRPSPEKVQARIDALERELGIDDQAVLAEVERERLRRTSKHRGPVILDAPLARLHTAVDSFELRPGFRWPVEDAANVSYVTASAVAHNFHQVMRQPSRVVLPDGVTA